MLTKITIENTFSIYEKTTFDFSKGKYTFRDNMIIKDKYVNPMFLYGLNGSGKSNFLNVFFVLYSIMNDSTDDMIAFNSNLYKGLEEPSKVTLTVLLNEKLYEYHLETNFHEIIVEKVIRIESEKRETLLSRNKINGQIYTKARISEDIEKTYPFIRYISTERELSKDPILKELRTLYNFIKNITYITSDGTVWGKIKNTQKLENILVNNSNKVKDLMREYGDFPLYDLELNVDNDKNETLYFKLENTKRKLKVDTFMSDGMMAHTVLLSVISELEPGSLLLVDEIERSLHPFILDKLIKDFNKFGIQLIATSHNTHTIQQLRPDQIYFSKWDDDSSVYEKLSDIYPSVREVNNLEKMYFSRLF